MSWTSSSGKLTRWSTFLNPLTPQRYVFAYPWDESPQRPAVPPRFPRLPPRTLVGFRLGSDLGSVIGRQAFTCAWLSVDRSNGPNCLRLRRANLDFTGQVASARLSPKWAEIGGYPPMLRRAAITK